MVVDVAPLAALSCRAKVGQSAMHALAISPWSASGDFPMTDQPIAAWDHGTHGPHTLLSHDDKRYLGCRANECEPLYRAAEAGEVRSSPARTNIEATCLVMIPVDDGGIGCKVICTYDDADHQGPHRTCVSEPCPNCWALECHAEWCPDFDTDPPPLLLDFTDDGTYWVAPIDSARNRELVTVASLPNWPETT